MQANLISTKLTSTATFPIMRKAALNANLVAAAIIDAISGADARSACVDAVVGIYAKEHSMAAMALNEALNEAKTAQDARLVLALAAALGSIGQDSNHEFHPLSNRRKHNGMRARLTAAAERLAEAR